ncbi:MAG: hypothetical protein SGI92_24665, partial [Bryobacteraceae bacterium]|nr:hypothetical protein [Bryobacteraceae bacterium]
DLDRTFWEILSTDHLQLLRNSYAYAAAPVGGHPITVSGPGIIDVTMFRQTQSITVHLVNLTNPMFLRGPVREITPVGPQRVTVRLPAGQSVLKVQLLTYQQPVQYVKSGSSHIVEVPEIAIHEIIAFEIQ